MSERTRTPPRLSASGRTERAERDARRAEALRANLHKRKAQERSRANDQAAPDDRAPTGGPGREGGGEA